MVCMLYKFERGGDDMLYNGNIHNVEQHEVSHNKTVTSVSIRRMARRFHLTSITITLRA